MPPAEKAASGPQGRALACHPDAACPPAVAHLAAAAERRTDQSLILSYALTGDLDRLALPLPGPAARADGLWRHTCFEAFVAGAGTRAYCEFNFAPAGAWAAYAFSGYRQGMAPLAIAAPGMAWRRTPDRLELEVLLPCDALPPGPLRLGLSAVIEAADARLSYWALRHPPGRPDFHHADAFALELP
jgi:hypothetical protein